MAFEKVGRIFKIVKKFGQLAKSENGFRWKIRVSEGFGVWKRVKLRSLRLGLWVESVVWTEKGKETCL